MPDTNCDDLHDKRQAILHATRKLFASQGYDNTTLAEIAQAARREYVWKAVEQQHQRPRARRHIVQPDLRMHLLRLTARQCRSTALTYRRALRKWVTQITLSYHISDLSAPCHPIKIHDGPSTTLLPGGMRLPSAERVGRYPDPSAAIMDSQSVKTVEESARIRGYDAHKCVKGRKRHLARVWPNRNCKSTTHLINR